MSFIWPVMLVSLLMVPVIAVVYARVMARRAAAAANAGLRLTEASGRRTRVPRRHIAPAIFLVAITLLLVSLARPQVVLALPRLEGTVILAFDVSTSMTAKDLKPSRMAAAKSAASAFVKKQPSTINLGVVAFNDSAFVVLAPTNDHDQALAAIDRLSPQGGSSLSEGMFASLGTIAGKPIQIPANASEDDILTMDIGHFSSAVIVMLTDGEHISRVDPLVMAELASGAGVRVYTIGLGTPAGDTLDLDGYHVVTELNEPLLREIAKTTEGTYLRAEDEQQLADTYKKIDLKLTTKGKETEVTSVLAATAAALLFAGSLLTIRWFGRVP